MATATLPSHPQIVALRAVREGLVRLDGTGCRNYPRYVRAAALDAAFRRGWWGWDVDHRVAYITADGQAALSVRGVDALAA